MNWNQILQLVLGICGSGGLVVGIIALLKVRPEAGQIVVTAAQGALLVQTGVIENLQKEISRLNTEILSLKLENEALRLHLDKMDKDQVRHETEINVLRAQNGHTGG